MPIPENIKRFGVVIEGIGDKIPDTQTSGDKTYLFYMLSKFVLFDRRYINYNVYTKPAVVAAADAAWEFQYSLVAYTSSSQVGSWRLCLTEAGNRLNKFDDYVQSTTLHYKICKKMAELYYEPYLLWADELENNLAPGAEPPEEVRARNLARNTYQNNNGVAMPYDPFVMEGGTHQYFAYPKIYKKTDPNLIMTNIILNRGIPDMFNFWTEARGKCGDDIFFEDGILKNVTIFSNLLNENYQPISHTFLYGDRMVYVTYTNKKLFRSEAKVFLIRSKKRDDVILDLPEYIDQICVFYTMKQWASNQWKNEGINYASTEKPVIFDRLSDLDVAGSYVQSMPLPYYIVNQLGLYLFYYKCGFYVCKPLEYSTQCRVLEYIRANRNPTLIPIEIIESYKFVGFRNSANYPFFCPELYNYNPDDIEAISHYYEHNIDIQQSLIRTMPINNDADLALIPPEPVAGVPIPVAAAGIQRVLTIDYPFLEREFKAVRILPLPSDFVSIPGRTRTLSKSGKQKYLMKYIGNPNRDIANDSNIGQPEIAASPSLNKAYTFLRDAVHVAVARLRRVMSFDQKDVPVNLATGVPVIPISGGYYRKRKTTKNQYNKRKTTKNQYKKRKTLKNQYKKRKTTKNQYKKRKTKKRRSRT